MITDKLYKLAFEFKKTKLWRKLFDTELFAVKYSLDKIGLSIGQKFKYIIDFGDEWTFNCKLLRIVDKKTPAPVVVKKQGEAPEQYGVWGN